MEFSNFICIIAALVSVILLTMTGCGGAPPIPEPPLPIINADRSVDDARNSGIHLEWMNLTVPPGEDFYNYACGGWMDSASIPEGMWSYSGFDQYYDVLNQDLLSLLTTSEPFEFQDAELARILFFSGLDAASIEALDITPIQGELELIDGIVDARSFSKVLGHLHLIGVTPFFKIHRPISWELLDRNYLYFRQTSLGLADGVVNYREADDSIAGSEEEFISDILLELGYNPEEAAVFASEIIDLEWRLASVSMSDYEMMEFHRNYNPVSTGALSSDYPSIVWEGYFEGLSIEMPDKVVVGQLDYFSEMDQVIADSNLDLIKTYLKWALISEFSPYLSSRFAEPSNRFREASLITSNSLDEMGMLSVVRREMPDVLGTMYLEWFFPDSTRERVNILIANLKVAYDRRLRESTWLDEDTKAYALAKLAAVRFAVGGREAPDYYGDLVLSENTLVENLKAIRELRMCEHLSHIDTPPSDDVWFQEAFNANRWSLPSVNTVLLPAAGVNELFRSECDDAFNYGAFGSTIAHEITHLFDRTGRGIDSQGRMRNWWTGDDLNQYEILTTSLIQYSEEMATEFNTALDGSNTFDENFADAMGLRVAHDAYMISLNGSESAFKDGFTGEQRLFIANAQKWRVLYNAQGLENELFQWHSPGQIRACAPAYLFSGFYEVFNLARDNTLMESRSGLDLIW